MDFPKSYRIELKNPTPIEYDNIRNTTGWDKLDLATIEKGLKKSLFSVCLYDINKLIGFGRIVGDGSMYFYIQDIIVIPEYQRKGFGRIIMNEVIQYLDDNANHNSFIGLMVAEGVEKFYHKFGFKTRPTSKPGMYLVYKKTL
ncbi:MAG: GNAT family N-acetyltransferase [Candidatus Cloacimonetes bacterium]|nr:GNAT family N-acetyltransferase [Candidatus Cloacimonadota bacterium]